MYINQNENIKMENGRSEFKIIDAFQSFTFCIVILIFDISFLHLLAKLFC